MGENAIKTLIVLVLAVVFLAHRTGFHKRIPAIAKFLAKRSRERLSGFEEQSSELAGDRLVWLDGGNLGKPAILLVHPFGVDKTVWLGVGAKLREAGFRVVAPDIFPTDASRKLDVTALARRLRAAMQAAKLSRPHVVGAGLGGTVSAALACAAPNEIRGLVLIEPLGFGSPYQSDVDRLIEKGRNPLLPSVIGQTDAFLRMLTVSPESIPEAERNRLGQLAVDQASTRERTWNDCLGGDKARLLDVLLPEIANKTLIVWGQRSRVAPVENAEGIRTVMRDVRVSVIPEAGHLVMLDQPDALVRTIRELVGLAG